MKLYVMTGPFGAGKTTWIGRLIEAAPDHGLRIAGVYTPAVFEDAEKTAIDAVLLPQKERFLFAPKRRDPHGEGRMLGWDFQPDALARINTHLSNCFDCDLLIIDELGPLEICRQEGFTQGLRLLDEEAVPAALVVIRPALLDAAKQRWGALTLLDPSTDLDTFIAQQPIQN